MKELRKVRWFKDSGMKNVVRKYGCLILMFCAAFLTGLTTGAVPVAAARTVQITYSGQTVDSFNGVEAKYIPGTGNSNSGTYSCAGYVKAYYKAIYGVDVYNLLTGKTPQASGHSFSRITSGFQAGDIVYHTNSAGSGHWAIAKAVNGDQITLIEQNWKWKSGGRTYASVERVVSPGSTANLAVYRMDGAGAQTNQEQQNDILSSPVAELLFDATYYANCYSDLRNAFGADEAALRNHYISCGIKEGRTASPIFDPKWYLANNSDVADAFGASNYEMAFTHFCAFGLSEGRQGSSVFDVKYYLNSYSDLKNAFGTDYISAARHFLTNGISELRQGSSQFSLKVYSESNPDVARTFSNPRDRICHFVEYVYYGTEKHRIYI